MKKFLYLTSFLSFLILFSNSSCILIRDEDNDDKLSLERQIFMESSLNIKGFYYTEIESFEEITYYSRYFLYNNGIIRNAGGVKSLENTNWSSSDNKLTWGVFNIEETNIKFEKWYPSSGGPFSSYIREGEILNDTTFHINESYRIVDGEKTEINAQDETYHFYKFSPKPDSTNTFIN